jgi:murein DD-endopeptidase MepM/ murein hydrolase activator NlpD
MRRAHPLAVLGLIAMVGTMAPPTVSPAHAAALEQGSQEEHQDQEAEPFPAWIPAGGLYGQQKWVPGSNGVDVFLPRGTEILAPVAGFVVAPAEVVYPYPPPVPAVALRGDAGLSFFMGHIRPLVSPGAQVQAGDPLGVVDDPAFDQVASPGPGPSGWQHLDLNVSRQGSFTWYGGDVPASPWLQRTGYEGTLVERTPGPSGEP